MKKVKILLYILIFAGLFFIPLESVEIANLEPVQGVWVYEENGNIVLETDTEAKGIGITVAEAMSDMKEHSPGVIYLDTAQYLFVSETAQEQISALQPYLKASVRLCKWEGQGSLKNAIEYADAHKVGVKLSKWESVGNLPELPTKIGNK